MAELSAIEWTDHTFNPWWGCQKIAQGCAHCYAERDAARFYGRRIWGPHTDRKIASEKVWGDPKRWDRAAKAAGVRARVFCLSMGDLLEDHPQLIEPRKRTVGIIESTPNLEWLLLTKRPQNHEWLGWGKAWPKNVMFGASAANQEEATAVVGELLHVPARLFLSLEPMIGPIKLDATGWRYELTTPPVIDWVIAGGESGAGRRPCEVEWFASLADECRSAGVPFFLKQYGEELSRRLGLKSRKGSDPAEWPEGLRIRQMPEAA